MFVIVPFTKVEAKTLGQLKSELKELEAKYKEAENDKDLREYRYPSCFDPAPALVYLIKSDKLGIVP